MAARKIPAATIRRPEPLPEPMENSAPVPSARMPETDVYKRQGETFRYVYLLRKAGNEDGILGPRILMHVSIQP